MTLRSELIYFAVQILANKTTLVRKTDPFESFLNGLFSLESDEEIMARNIEVELDRAIASVKRVNLNRKFNKIVQNV